MQSPPSVVRLGAAIAAAAAIALASPDALAEGRKVLVVTPGATPFSARVRAEIEEMGFEVEPAAVLAREGSGAIAAARVLEGTLPSVEIWIADETGKLTLRARVDSSPTDDEAAQRDRASAHLRALFGPLLAPLPAAPPTVVVIAPPVDPSFAPPPAERGHVAPSRFALPSSAAAAPAPSRFSLGVGLAVPFQPGGPALDLEVSGRWMPASHVGLGAFASVPLAGSTVKEAEGSASLSVPLFGLDVSAMASPASWVRVSASAGLAVAWVRASGSATAPYVGKSADAVAAVPIFGAEIAPRLGDRVHLYIDGRAGFSLSRVDLAFAGRSVATWGRPLGMIGAGIGVDL